MFSSFCQKLGQTGAPLKQKPSIAHLVLIMLGSIFLAKLVFGTQFIQMNLREILIGLARQIETISCTAIGHALFFLLTSDSLAAVLQGELKTIVNPFLPISIALFVLAAMVRIGTLSERAT